MNKSPRPSSAVPIFVLSFIILSSATDDARDAFRSPRPR